MRLNAIDRVLEANEAKACGCWNCLQAREDMEGMMRMVLCPDCGNKRCPKAKSHTHVCTKSNEPGQPGSAYEDAI